MITLRLDEQLEKEIIIVSELHNISKSELIRRSINEFLLKEKESNSWELGKEYFGKYSSDNENLAENSKILFKNKLKAKMK